MRPSCCQTGSGIARRAQAEQRATRAERLAEQARREKDHERPLNANGPSLFDSASWLIVSLVRS